MIDIAEESEYQYPFLLFCGEIQLHTHDCHPSEERSRFRSESISENESSVVGISPSSLADKEVSGADHLDLEVSQASACNTSVVSSPDSLPPSSSPLIPKIRLNSPFVGVCDDDDCDEYSYHASMSVQRVWQSALLGLPFEMAIEVSGSPLVA